MQAGFRNPSDGTTRPWDSVARSILLVMLLTPPCSAAILNVPGDYPTIQDAIDDADAGDTVLVEPGTYIENLSLESNVNLSGRETARTIVRADSNSEPIVTISSESNITVRNLTLSDSDQGIDITDSNVVTIANVVMERLDDAVTVDDDSSIDLRNIVFWNNDVAVDRDTELVVISNSIFAANDTTITSSGGNADDDDANVSFNCFFDNEDLDDNGSDDGLGNNFQLGDPLFVDTAARDFHLRPGSPCIDAGSGIDNIDATIADIGAYGGSLADLFPYPVDTPTLADTSTTAPAVTNIAVSWRANLAYLVSDSSNPGSYRVWYRANAPGPPYDGTDAGGGTRSSPIDVGNVVTFTLADLTASVSMPATPALLAAEPADEAITLRWGGSAGATGYEIAYGIDSLDENTVVTGPVTEYTVADLRNDATYMFAITALAQATYYVAVTARDSTPAMNESVLSSASSLGIGDTLRSARSNVLTGIPEELVPFPDLADDCFVATAAYGAGWQAEVAALRDFRERFLLTNDAGRAFTAWYYRHGPRLAATLRRHEHWKPLVRAGLSPLVVLALFMLGSSQAVKAVALGLVGLLITCVTQRRLRERLTAAT